MIENESETEIIRCNKCGFPLKKSIQPLITPKQSLNEQKSFSDSKYDNLRLCYICRRERILNSILISSYVVSGAILIICIIGIILKQITISLCLLVVCLGLIFLFLFGQFLEKAVFFKLPNREKLLASLYRYSITAEPQAFDIMYNFLPKVTSLDEEIIKGLFQVTVFQPKNLPITWFAYLGKILRITSRDIILLFSNLVDGATEKDYLTKIVKKAPPSGISMLLEIFLISKNILGINAIISRVETELLTRQQNNEWLNEFYIYYKQYYNALQQMNRKDILHLIDEKLKTYKEPKVPSIDVIESSKNIIQRNPIIRYLFRILFLIFLAFILSLLYRLLD